MEWIGGPPSIAEWNNANLHLAEDLGEKYRVENLVRLDFVPIPETEDEYRVEAEIVTDPSPKSAHKKMNTVAQKKEVFVVQLERGMWVLGETAHLAAVQGIAVRASYSLLVALRGSEAANQGQASRLIVYPAL